MPFNYKRIWKQWEMVWYSSHKKIERAKKKRVERANYGIEMRYSKLCANASIHNKARIDLLERDFVRTKVQLGILRALGLYAKQRFNALTFTGHSLNLRVERLTIFRTSLTRSIVSHWSLLKSQEHFPRRKSKRHTF